MLETTKVQLLRNAMQTYHWRMQAISSNLANLDTPDYQRITVTFEDRLQDAMHRVDGPRSLYDVDPRMQVEEDAPVLEDEMMELADTQMRNQVAARALREHFSLLRAGITGQSAG